VFKQRKLPALAAQRLEIDQGLYDDRANSVCMASECGERTRWRRCWSMAGGRTV